MERLEYTVGAVRVRNKITNKPQNQVWVNFTNLHPDDLAMIAGKFNRKCLEKNGVLSFMTPDPSNERNAYTYNIMQALREISLTDHYAVPSLSEFMSELEDSLKDILSPQDIKDTNKGADELWLKFMRQIQDPKIQLLLKSMGQYSLAETTYGWKISANNLMRTLAKKPEATFVQTRKAWRAKYGRRVKPQSTPIGLQVPVTSKHPTMSDMQKRMADVGYSNNVRFKDLSQQQRDYIDISAREMNETRFTYVVYYDVSDTELIDPSGRDKWAEEVGYDNNLTGHLNRPAIDQRAATSNITHDEANELYNGEEGNVKELTIALANGVRDRYPDIQFVLPKVDNNDAYLKAYSDILAKLADKLIEEKGKVVKKENRSQGIDIAVTIVMCLTRVNALGVAKRLNNQELTEESYFELRNVINMIISLMKAYTPKQESIKINEMEFKTLDSVDELLNMMGMTRADVRPTEDGSTNESIKKKEAVKEHFNSFMKRIQESDKNRLEWREN